MSKTPEVVSNEPDVKPEELVKVLSHVATELEVLSGHQNLDRAAAAEAVRRRVQDWLLESRRAAAAVPA